MKKLMFLLFASLFQTFAFAQQGSPDSLLNLLENAKDTARVNILLELSKSYNGVNKAMSVAYAQQAQALSKKHHFPKGEAYALKCMGMAYVNEGNYPLVINYWEQSLTLFNSIGDKVGASNMLNNIGVLYSIQGWEAKAIEYYLKALKIGEDSGDKLRIASALLNLGAEYYHNPSTHDKALAYYLKALPISKEIGDIGMTGTLTVNLGEIYLQQGDYKKALAYSEEALGLLEAYGVKDKVAYTLNNLGRIYTSRGNLTKAMEYHLKAKKTAESVSANLELAQALNYIGNIHLRRRQPHRGLTSHKEAQKVASGLGASYELKNSYIGIANAYAKLSDYRQAFNYQNLLLDLKDSLYNAESREKIESLQTNYEVEKNLAHIDLLTKDKELQQHSLQRQQVLRNGLLVVLALIIFLSFVLFLNIRNKIKANRLLKHKNAEISAQKEEIAIQHEHLEQTYNNLISAQEQLVQSEKMASLGQLTAGVAHEINNPINFVSAGIDSLASNMAEIMEIVDGYLALDPEADNELQLQKLEKLNKEKELNALLKESRQLFRSIQNGAIRTKEIVKSLKNFSRTDESELRKADLHEGIDSTLVILNNQLKDRIKIVKNYGKLEDIDCYPGQLNQVFMNILSNAAQAIEGEGTISITTYTENNCAVIKIKDTGKGMTEEVKKHIFEPFFTTKEVGKGTGLGLSISYGIIERHHGKIEVTTKPGAGTEFTIKLPLILSGKSEAAMQLEAV